MNYIFFKGILSKYVILWTEKIHKLYLKSDWLKDLDVSEPWPPRNQYNLLLKDRIRVRHTKTAVRVRRCVEFLNVTWKNMRGS